MLSKLFFLETKTDSFQDLRVTKKSMNVVRAGIFKRNYDM